MKLKLLRALAWVALKGRLYYAWSRMYRWLWQRRYKDVVIPSYTTLDGIASVVARMRWRADGWRELWDAISDPRATWSYHVNDLGKEGPANDCDDISMWAVDRIQQAVDAGALNEVDEVGMLSVPWLDDGEAGGHNVCVVCMFDGWRHMSNWHNGKLIGPFDDLQDVTRDVLAGRKSLGWAYCSSKLKLRRYGRGGNL